MKSTFFAFCCVIAVFVNFTFSLKDLTIYVSLNNKTTHSSNVYLCNNDEWFNNVIWVVACEHDCVSHSSVHSCENLQSSLFPKSENHKQLIVFRKLHLYSNYAALLHSSQCCLICSHSQGDFLQKHFFSSCQLRQTCRPWGCQKWTRIIRFHAASGIAFHCLAVKLLVRAQPLCRYCDLNQITLFSVQAKTSRDYEHENFY